MKITKTIAFNMFNTVLLYFSIKSEESKFLNYNTVNKRIEKI